MLTQGDVESELERLSKLLEARTDEYARIVVAAAEAEVAYERRKAEQTVLEANTGAMEGRQLTVSERSARVTMRVKEEMAIHKIKEAQVEGLKQLLYSIRTQINALQTVAANIRGQT